MAHDQYSELTEDDLIELAAQKADGNEVKDLIEVVQALKVRRDATQPSRRRVGLYLRQAALQQVQYDHDMASGSDYSRRNARQPSENIDSLRFEEWSASADLRLSDLQRLVPTVVFDGKQRFMEVQADRLEQWKNHPDYAALPEKQRDLLPCIAAQHISDGYRGWTHDSSGIGEERLSCYTNIHQSTMNSLLKKKHIVGTRTRPGMTVHRSSWLILKDPSA